ncbi:penicillin-binding transpeptidase domain-containing protein [Streptomyces sp. NPDC058045]|uniref:penicillin-binding transpeptidase domain-containing protein n=1 Tax=Streptomyces sp. NPDC058045 TaxID=3346311 RepID=UPI0036E4B09F
MTAYIRRSALLCGLLLVALLVNAVRVQLVEADERTGAPGDRRPAIARYAQPRGPILVAGRPVTGSRDSHQQLRYERTYTEGPLYAPVTGYSSQFYGNALLEQSADPVLSGTDQALSRWPRWPGTAPRRFPGGRVETTLDPRLQRAAYRGLGGRRGAVAALDPATGRVLALVSTPSYDPGKLSGNGPSVRRTWQRLARDPDRPMLNRALAQTYPPGSTFKVVTAAAALESGRIDDVDAPTDSPEPYTLPGTRTRLANEARGCADASLREAFAWSCNTVFAKLGVDVGLPAMVDTARRFGFNDASLRIPVPVSPSTFDTTMDRPQLALSAIGQYDTRATPLQMAMVAAAVADGGVVQAPHLVDRVATRDGRTVSETGTKISHQAMSPETADRMRELMTEAVEHGTGSRAAIPGATVGGKTGTAQHGRGNSGTPYAWFISWAQPPDTDRPAVAVAVVVEDKAAHRTDISGGGTAAPIARAVMEAALRR